jgi:hypothetical protein
MHHASRRAMTILALFVLLSSLGAGSALAGAAAPHAPTHVAPAIVIGSNSCQGINACSLAVGPIGDNSCNGYFACYDAEGEIGDNSCNGDEGSCESTWPGASVGDNSCNGSFICLQLVFPVGNCENNDVQPAACDTQPDGRIRRVGRHNLVGNDIYNTDASGQTLNATLEPYGKARFSITIQNDADVADSFTLGASLGVFPASGGGLSIKFLHGWPKQDITAAVLAGTYQTPTIAPHGKFRLRLVLKNVSPAAALDTALVYRVLLTATSVGNPANEDAVAVDVSVLFVP